jgi:adenylate cyclase
MDAVSRLADAGDDQREAFELVESRLLGHAPLLTANQVAERAGVDRDQARSLWVAMGFPAAPEDTAMFTDADAEALILTLQLQEVSNLGPEALLRLARVTSQAMATVATAHVDALTPEDEVAGGERLVGVAEFGERALPILDRLFPYLYRRHLAAAIQLTAVVTTTTGTTPVAVGFADLAGFTRAASLASNEELTQLVDDFLAAAADIVANGGGRVIKLIGDEVMFSVRDAKAAAEIALRLSEMHERADGALPVHTGVACGPVLSHQGDLFGTTVNVASRLTDVCRPGRVLINDSMAADLAGDPRFRVRRSRIRHLKHVGNLRVYSLARRSDSTDQH